MMTQAHVAEQYSAYLDGRLPEATRQAVEAHLHACPQCAAELDALRRLVAELRALPEVPAPAALVEALRARRAARASARPWFLRPPALAGGALAAAALAVALLLPHPPQPQLAKAPAPAPKPLPALGTPPAGAAAPEPTDNSFFKRFDFKADRPADSTTRGSGAPVETDPFANDAVTAAPPPPPAAPPSSPAASPAPVHAPSTGRSIRAPEGRDATTPAYRRYTDSMKPEALPERVVMLSETANNNLASEAPLGDVAPPGKKGDDPPAAVAKIQPQTMLNDTTSPEAPGATAVEPMRPLTGMTGVPAEAPTVGAPQQRSTSATNTVDLPPTVTRIEAPLALARPPASVAAGTLTLHTFTRRVSDARITVQNAVKVDRLSVRSIDPRTSRSEVAAVSGSTRDVTITVPLTTEGSVTEIATHAGDAAAQMRLYLLAPSHARARNIVTLAHTGVPAYRVLQRLAVAGSVFILCPPELAEKEITFSTRRTPPRNALAALLAAHGYHMQQTEDVVVVESD